MHKPNLEFDKLDALISDHPSAHVPKGFSERVMQRIDLQTPWVVLWERPWVQWAAASIGLVFALGRLLSYIFSAWLTIELAG